MQKSDRHNAILRIIGTAKIGRQDQLVAALASAGFNVTQASVSRDLDELGIVKTNGYYTQPANTDPRPPFGMVSLEPAGENLLVLKCASGLASALAVRIDAAHIDEIVGTIAGDDTIFIALNDQRAQKAIMRKVWGLFEE